jgi:hypothetical protein
VRMNELLAPVDESGLFASDERAPEVHYKVDNRGRPVFCVPASRAVQGAAVGVAAGIASAVVFAVAFPASVGVFLLVSGIGFGAGKATQRLVCSDPACDATIPTSARLCPGCGGVVVGHIASRNERLKAEEAWRRTTHASARGSGRGQHEDDPDDDGQ